MSTTPAQPPAAAHGPAPAALRRALVFGVALIFGGETLCIFGPQQQPRLMHVVCHAILYSGIVLCLWGALMYARSRFARLTSQNSPPTTSQEGRPR